MAASRTRAYLVFIECADGSFKFVTRIKVARNNDDATRQAIRHLETQGEELPDEGELRLVAEGMWRKVPYKIKRTVSIG